MNKIIMESLAFREEKSINILLILEGFFNFRKINKRVFIIFHGNNKCE